MQGMWRGAVTLLELGTVVLCSTTGSENEEAESQKRGGSQRQAGPGVGEGAAHRGRWQENSETMGAKLENEKTVSVFQWIGGETARPQEGTPPYLLPPLDNGFGW